MRCLLEVYITDNCSFSSLLHQILLHKDKQRDSLMALCRNSTKTQLYQNISEALREVSDIKADMIVRYQEKQLKQEQTKITSLHNINKFQPYIHKRLTNIFHFSLKLLYFVQNCWLCSTNILLKGKLPVVNNTYKNTTSIKTFFKFNVVCTSSWYSKNLHVTTCKSLYSSAKTFQSVAKNKWLLYEGFHCQSMCSISQEIIKIFKKITEHTVQQT